MRQRCGNDGVRANGLLCFECYERLKRYTNSKPTNDPTSERKLLLLHVPQSLSKLERFHFDIPLRAEEIAGAKVATFSSLQSLYTNLSAIINLAIFADIYGVQSLLEAVSVMLYRKLAQESRNLENNDLEKILELANTVYENTASADHEQNLEEKHILRRMIADFIAIHHNKFARSLRFRETLFHGGDITCDVFAAMVNLSELAQLKEQKF